MRKVDKQPSMKIEIRNKPVLAMNTQADSAVKIPSSSADIDRSGLLKGLRLPPQSSSKLKSECKEIRSAVGKFDEGHASAGIRPPDDVLGAGLVLGTAAARLQNSCTKN